MGKSEKTSQTHERTGCLSQSRSGNTEPCSSNAQKNSQGLCKCPNDSSYLDTNHFLLGLPSSLTLGFSDTGKMWEQGSRAEILFSLPTDSLLCHRYTEKAEEMGMKGGDCGVDRLGPGSSFFLNEG